MFCRSHGVGIAMMSTTEITRQITVSDFKKGGMDFRSESITARRSFRRSANRMKTAFTFYDGKTESDGAESNPTPDLKRTGESFGPASGAIIVSACWFCPERRPCW